MSAEGSSQKDTEDIDYSNIDCSVLGANDLGVVKEAIVEVSAKYYDLGVQLDIPAYELDKLPSYYDVNKAFNDMVHLWLKGVSNKRGTERTPPSWRSLVRAVASRTGGNNYALAERIASEHRADQAIPHPSIMEEPCEGSGEPRWCSKYALAKEIASRHKVQDQAQDTEEVADKDETGQNTEPSPTVDSSKSIGKQPAVQHAANCQCGIMLPLVIAVVVCVASVVLGLAGQGIIKMPSVSDIDEHTQEPVNSYYGDGPNVLNQRPKMNQLVILERSGGRDPVRIIERIGAQNSEIGTILLNDERGVIMDTIKHNARGNAEVTNKEMFRRWLAGGGAEVSWKVLVDTLVKLQFKALADDIVDALRSMS